MNKTKMSNHSISLVPKKSLCPNRDLIIKNILEWLISYNIIEAEISDCILGKTGGYRGAQGLKNIVQHSEDLTTLLKYKTFGLEIVKDKNVFDTGENGLESMTCPNCNKKYDVEVYNFITIWWDTQETDIFCTACDKIYDINEYLFRPQWAFSNLGFKFWNFPQFTSQFIEEFQLRLQCDVVIVYQHL